MSRVDQNVGSLDPSSARAERATSAGAATLVALLLTAGLVGGILVVSGQYDSCAANAGSEAGYWCGLPALAMGVLVAALCLLPYPGVVMVLAVDGHRRVLGYALAILPGLVATAFLLLSSTAAALEAGGMAHAGLVGLATTGVTAGSMYLAARARASGSGRGSAIILSGVSMSIGLVVVASVVGV